MRTGPRGRSLLAALVASGLGRLSAFAERIGRGALYAGLVLVALTDVRLPSDVAVADVALGISLVCALLALIRGPRPPARAFGMHAAGAFLFMLGIALSTTQSYQNTPQNLLNLGKFLFTTSFLFLASVVLLKRSHQLRIALGSWVCSVTLTSAVALAQAVHELDAGEVVRMSGLTNNPNHLGAVAGLGVAGALSLAMRSAVVWRLLWFAAIVLAMAAVALSGSRTGAVTAIGALGFWLIGHFRLKRDVTLTIAAVSCGAVALAAVLSATVSGSNSLTQRFVAVADPVGDRSVQARLDQYDFVLYHSLKSPLVGVGLAEQDSATPGLIDIHNLYLRAFYGGGVLTLLGLLFIIGDLAAKSYSVLVGANDYDTKLLALATGAGVIGLALAGMTEPIFYQRQLWALPGFALALWVILRVRQASVGPGAAPLLAQRQQRSERNLRPRQPLGR